MSTATESPLVVVGSTSTKASAMSKARTAATLVGGVGVAQPNVSSRRRRNSGDHPGTSSIVFVGGSQSFDSLVDDSPSPTAADRSSSISSTKHVPSSSSAFPPVHSLSERGVGSAGTTGTIKRVQRRSRASREDRRSMSLDAFRKHPLTMDPQQQQPKGSRRNLSHDDNFFDQTGIVADDMLSAFDTESLQLHQQRLQEQQQILLQQQMQLQQIILMQQQQQQYQQQTSQSLRPPPPQKRQHRRANSDNLSYMIPSPQQQHHLQQQHPSSHRSGKSTSAAGRTDTTTPGSARPRLNSADQALVKSKSASSLTVGTPRPELTKTHSGRGPELQSIAHSLGSTGSRITPPPSPYGGALLPSHHHGSSLSLPPQQLLQHPTKPRLFTLNSSLSSEEPSERDPMLQQHPPRGNSITATSMNYNSVAASPYIPRRHSHVRHHSAQRAMTEIKGTPQPLKCHHMFFSLLFYAQLIAVLILSAKFGRHAMANYHNMTLHEVETYILKYPHVLQMAVCAGFFACAFSGLTLIALTVFSSDVIQICLIFSIIMSFAWGTVGIGFQPASFVPITGIIALAFCIGYAFVVWSRIPFAAANLKCGLAGVPSGVVILAYLSQMLALGWSIVWTFGLLGVYDLVLSATDDPTNNPQFLYVLFAVSYWWTLQVIKNVLQVTVAGTVGRWWSGGSPSASENPTTTVTTSASCCPKVVRECFRSSMTYNFGSICYGSLLVDFIYILRQVCEPMRPKDSPSLLIVNECMLPLQKCLFSSIDYLVSRFNQWSFTYVGLYNYDFTQASVQAMYVLESRGWTNIVTDDLLNNVLTIFSLVIGGCTGCFCALLERIDDYQLASVPNPNALSFGIGFIIGLVLSSILMGVVSSAVNTVIICFAENPLDFQTCHPDLCEELNTAWVSVWPGCLTVTGTKMIQSSNINIDMLGRSPSGYSPSMRRAFLPYDV